MVMEKKNLNIHTYRQTNRHTCTYVLVDCHGVRKINYGWLVVFVKQHIKHYELFKVEI